MLLLPSGSIEPALLEAGRHCPLSLNQGGKRLPWTFQGFLRRNTGAERPDFADDKDDFQKDRLTANLRGQFTNFLDVSRRRRARGGTKFSRKVAESL